MRKILFFLNVMRISRPAASKAMRMSVCRYRRGHQQERKKSMTKYGNRFQAHRSLHVLSGTSTENVRRKGVQGGGGDFKRVVKGGVDGVDAKKKFLQ